MALRKSVSVDRKSGEKRGGRGFSRGELKKAGISLRQALRLKLPVDVRRRSAHDENVKLVKQQLQSLLKREKKALKAKRKVSRRKRSQGSKS